MKLIHNKKTTENTPINKITEEDDSWVQRADKENKPPILQVQEPIQERKKTEDKTQGKNLPIILQDNDEETSESVEEAPRRSSHLMFQRPNGAAFMARDMVWNMLANLYYEAPEWPIPTKLKDNKLTIELVLDVEDVANGVVHPTTGDTITKYKARIKDPILKEIWEEVMCRELGRLVQGYKDVEGTSMFKK